MGNIPQQELHHMNMIMNTKEHNKMQTELFIRQFFGPATPEQVEWVAELYRLLIGNRFDNLTLDVSG